MKKSLILLLYKKGINLRNIKKYGLIRDYDELINIINNLKENKFKFLFFYKSNIHQILYDSQSIININTNEMNLSKISHFFYLSILIKDNPELINYSYSFEFIKNIYESVKNLDSNKILIKIIISKISIEFINNFKGLNTYNNENDEDLDKIQSYYLAFIQDNIKELNLNIDITSILNKKVDEIFIEIIISLIKSNKFTEYKYTDKILSDLDFSNIYLTEEMFEQLYITLNQDEVYINKYIIKCKEDLFVESKINFYFFLLKYILKESYYFYYFPFLLKTRKLIINLLKSNEFPYDFINNNIKDKMEYIIKSLVDINYYFFNISEDHLMKLKEILKYYTEYLFESKKEDINLIKYIIKNKKGNYKNYIQDYNLAKKMNVRIPIIKYLFYENKKKIDSENEINNYVKNWDILEKTIIDKKIQKINKKKKELLIKYFKDTNNKELLLKIFKKDTIEYFIKEDENSIEKSKIKEISRNTDKKKSFTKISYLSLEDNKVKKQTKEIISNNILYDDESLIIKENYYNPLKRILNKSSFLLHTNQKGENPFVIFYGVLYNEFGEINYTKIEYQKFLDFTYNDYLCSDNLKKNISKFLDFINNFKCRLKNEFKYNYNLYIKLDFQNEYNNNFDNIYNISCNYTFYEPFNYKPLIFREDNNILVNGFNSNMKSFKSMINEINKECYKDIKYKNIYEIIGINTLNSNYIIGLKNDFYLSWGNDENKIYIYDEHFNKKKIIKRFKRFIDSITNIFEINYKDKSKEESYIIICSNINWFLFKINLKEFKYYKISEFYQIQIFKFYKIEGNNKLYTFNNGGTCSIGEYKNSLKVNNDIIVLTSNSLIKEGKDKLIFYNKKRKEITNKIEGYSFSLNQNSLALMYNSKTNNEVLICVCTKYLQHQKNGLFIIPQLKNNQMKKVNFYNTGNFKPYCICPLTINDNQKENMFNNEDIIIKYTDYFLVGGFDLENGKGKIRLYQLIYSNILSDIEIEFKEDIVIKGDEGIIEFESTVNCIIQSKNNGNILSLCYNGDLYIFPVPNIN